MDMCYDSPSEALLFKAKGIDSVVARYPPGFIVMLRPIIQCLIQGLSDVEEIKDYLYEDTCEGLLVNHCHCRGMIHGCLDCEDSMVVDSLACGFIEAMLRTITIEPDSMELLLKVTEPGDFSDFDVNILDPDTLIVRNKKCL